MARYLVVHGLADARAALAKGLAALDPRAEVRDAEWGEEGIRLDGEWKPDAVFLGLIFADRAPDVATMESLLQSRPARPVVLCTRLPREDPHVVRALSVGAAAYVPLPVLPGPLRDSLREIEPLMGKTRRL